MTIEYSSNFVRSFRRLLIDIQRLAIEQERIFRLNPIDSRLHAKPLRGRLKGLWSFRVTRRYRVLYAWKAKNSALFYEIEHRRFVYQ
ncbi:hypothetical protein HZA86_04770 [Candidatus Uhrbacteria bacterium]|nr:hypothetical protein [Candidatus Uhrbacteria bacterium]